MQMKQERTGISEDDPLVQRLRENILKETGVELDQLLNPSKARGSHTPLGALHVAEAGSVGDNGGYCRQRLMEWAGCGGAGGEPGVRPDQPPQRTGRDARRRSQGQDREGPEYRRGAWPSQWHVVLSVGLCGVCVFAADCQEGGHAGPGEAARHARMVRAGKRGFGLGYRTEVVTRRNGRAAGGLGTYVAPGA